MNRLKNIVSAFSVLSIALLMAFSVVQTAVAQQSDQSLKPVELVLGVYAYQEKQTVREQYQGLADYLSSSVSGTQVVLEVLDAKDLRQGVKDHRIDLILPNPSLYEVMRNENDLGGVLATVETLSSSGVATSQLGGVIFTHSDNSDVNALQDMVNQSIAIPGTSFTGAYRVPLFEVIQSGITKKQLNFFSLGSHDAVIESVLSRQSDVGFIRTGILEQWFDQQRVQPEKIKVIHSQNLQGFPYLVSTSLYPEWPFVVSARLDLDLVRDVSAALFSLHRDHPVAIQAGIAGFVPPKDYLPLETLLRNLRLEPYDEIPEFSFYEAVQSHPIGFAMGLGVIFIFAVGLSITGILLSRLKDKTEKFDELMFATNAMTWEWNLKTGEVDINDNWAKIIGFRVDELSPFSIQKWWQLMHPNDRKRVGEVINDYQNGNIKSYEVEFRLKHKKGHWVWLLAKGRVVAWSKDKQPLRMTGIHTDIDELKQKELKLKSNAKRDQILLDLPGLAEMMNEKDFMQHAQELTEMLTGSKMSFIHFLSDDGQTVELVAWSKRTLKKGCQLGELESHYPLEDAGIWADAARQSKPIVINDYKNYPEKNGLPQGHAELERVVSLPVIEDNCVVMLTGVGNKDENYTDQDVETVQLISNEIWRLVKGKRIQQQILEQTTQFHRLVNDLGPDHVVFSYSVEKQSFLYMSDTASVVFGVDSKTVITKSWTDMVKWLPDSLELAMSYYHRIVSGQETYNQFDVQLVHGVDESLRTVKVSQHGVYDEQGQLLTIDGLVVNVTEQKEAERKLKEAARVFEYAQEGILITSPQGVIVNVNDAFTRITGFKKADVVGQNPKILSSGHQSKEFYEAMWDQLLTQGHWHGEIWNKRKNGEIYPQKINMTTVRSEQGDVEQYIALFSDISLEKQQKQELEFIAHFDPLTGLPNRVLLTDRLNQAVTFSERHNKQMAVVFIDLDGFKEVNDDFGHAAGDALLSTLAKRFDTAVRKGDTVSRIGGDEFVVVFPELSAAKDLKPILQRLLNEAKGAVHFQGVDVNVSASIGVTLYDGSDENVSADLLIRHADQAMYQAKMQGKNQIAYFEGSEPIQVQGALERREKLLEIEAGMNADEFELFYQPKLHVYAPDVIELEALIRWRKADDLVPPIQFLPFLENQPLGVRLGYWVIEQAISEVQVLATQEVDCTISVNIDGYLIEQSDFFENVQAIFEKYPDVLPEKLTMELLESSALDDIEKVTTVIERLRGFGVRFAIDDFGTGYASLNYLKRLPVDELKVDQSFIKDIFDQPQGMVILESVVSMAKAFDMQVVAEGVETQEHIDLLLELGLEVLQGYALSRPMPFVMARNWVLQQPSITPWQRVKPLDRPGVLQRIAILEFNKWLEGIRTCLGAKECEYLEIQSVADCPFGKWLYSEGVDRLEVTLFKDIEEAHEQIYLKAKHGFDLKIDGQLQQVQSCLQEIAELERKFNAMIRF